jgi:hypothetical protein
VQEASTGKEDLARVFGVLETHAFNELLVEGGQSGEHDRLKKQQAYSAACVVVPHECEKRPYI